MVKTKIVETTEKYDKDGKLVEKVTREETTEDDTAYTPSIPWTAQLTQPWYNTDRPLEPYCTLTSTNENDGFGKPVDSKGV